MENLIIQIFSIVIQSLLDLYIIIVMSKKLSKVDKYSKKQVLLLFGCIFIISLLTLLFNNTKLKFLKSLIVIIGESISASIILKQKIIYSLLIEISLLAIFAIAELIGASIIKVLFDNSNINSILINIIVISIIDSIVFLITIILNKVLDKKFINMLSTISNKHILFLGTSTLIYIFPQMLLFLLNKYSYPMSFMIISCVQFIVINIFTFYFLKKDMDFQKSRSDLITSEVHNKTLIGMIDGVRTLKHDYNNIIQSLNGYVVTKQYDKLEDHIKSLLKECNGINNISTIDQKIFNDPAVYGIVGSKYFVANEKGIPFEFDITTDIASLEFPKPELSRILGILLDNAIEATTKSDNPYIRLQMRFDNRKCADIIKLYNSYDTNIDIDLQDIFKKGFSSKEVKSGIGLWEVKKLVKQNPNAQIYASIEENMFVQNIVIER